MAYNAILDTQLDPDAPITSGLGYQLRDNPIAIANGAAGAPGINGALSNISAGAIGGWVFGWVPSSTDTTFGYGSTVSGANLYPAAMQYEDGDTEPYSWVVRGTAIGVGTWMCLGYGVTNDDAGQDRQIATMWQRIS